MMFVKNNEITHNFELKLYLVTDEKFLEKFRKKQRKN